MFEFYTIINKSRRVHNINKIIAPEALYSALASKYMYMDNPMMMRPMKPNKPWDVSYMGHLFMRQLVMNQKEWKQFCKIDKAKAHYWYNKVTKKRISRDFEQLENCDVDAKVIHHLRDTEEQRKYNDEHYELFGFEIDENGNESFNYGKYVVFWTKEHHNEYHQCSEETRKKRSDSLKGIPRTDEWRKKLSDSNKGKTIPDEQRKQISESVSNLWKSEEYRERHSKATKEAMWRPDVRQRFLDGCKKRPPMSKEARQRAAESNRGKRHTDETKQKLSLIKKEYYRQLHLNQAASFNYAQELQDIGTTISTKYNLDTSVVTHIVNLISSVHCLESMSTSKDVSYVFNSLCINTLINWNTFRSIFFKVRRLFIRRIKYEQLL